MGKIIVTTEEELEALIKKVLKEVLLPVVQQKEANISEEIMNIKQVSQLLGISVPTIYGKTSARTIPHFKKGKKLYFKKQELFAWIEKDKRKTTEELLTEWEENQSKSKRR